MRSTDELVSTHIYSILHSISIQKRVELKVEILKLIIRYSELIIRILFNISKRTKYEYEYHYSVFYYSNIRITNYSLQHWYTMYPVTLSPLSLTQALPHS